MGGFFQWLQGLSVEKKEERAAKTDMVPSAGIAETAVNSTEKKVGFSASYTLGNHLYRSRGEKVSIEFDNAERGIHKQIIDNNGRILQFPGIIEEGQTIFIGRKARNSIRKSFV